MFYIQNPPVGVKAVRLIGMSGLEGSGKDTVADYLELVFGYKKLSFAHPLKTGLAAIIGVDVAQFDNREYKDTVLPWLGKSPRQLLQSLGTEWGRDMVDSNFWIMLAERRLLNTKWLLQRTVPNGFVFSDIRFENEAALIRKHGGTLIHVTREGSGLEGETANHRSAAGVRPEGSILLENNCATLAELYEKVKEIICSKS